MICKHCHKEIVYKKGVWHSSIAKEDKLKLGMWGGIDFSPYTAICVLSVSEPPEFGDHEPSKESKVKSILKTVDNKLAKRNG